MWPFAPATSSKPSPILRRLAKLNFVNGVADGETVRGLLTSLIRAEVTKQVLAAAKEAITEADRDEIARQLAEQGTTGIPDTLRDLIIELNAANAVLARVQAPSADDVSRTLRKESEVTRHVVRATPRRKDRGPGSCSARRTWRCSHRRRVCKSCR